jgi:hypothetical protein
VSDDIMLDIIKNTIIKEKDVSTCDIGFLRMCGWCVIYIHSPDHFKGLAVGWLSQEPQAGSAA